MNIGENGVSINLGMFSEQSLKLLGRALNVAAKEGKFDLHERRLLDRLHNRFDESRRELRRFNERGA